MGELFPEGDLDEAKGWNRASLMYWSRQPYVPNVHAKDLLMPSGRGNLRLLAMCGVMSVCMTVLYLWVPLYLLNFFVPVGGLLYGASLGGSLLVLTGLMYVLGTRETRRDQEHARRL